MQADLSVVVPAYNGEVFLPATLDSLRMQEDARLEVLVVDDGSKDGSAALAEAHPAVDLLLSQPNRGVAAARNLGLSHASSPYVAFVDQDDLWHPRRARTLLDLARTTSAVAVGTTETSFARERDRAALEAVGDGRHSWPSIWIDDVATEVKELMERPLSDLGGSGRLEHLDVARFMESPAAVTTSFMYDRHAAIAAGGCAPWVRAADDHVLNLCLARLFGPIVRVDTPCLYYRVHPASTSTVSPLAAPFLSMHLAMRWGRLLPRDASLSGYMAHLVDQLPVSGLSVVEQMSVVALSVPPGHRLRAIARWGRSLSRARLRRPKGVIA